MRAPGSSHSPSKSGRISNPLTSSSWSQACQEHKKQPQKQQSILEVDRSQKQEASNEIKETFQSGRSRNVIDVQMVDLL